MEAKLAFSLYLSSGFTFAHIFHTNFSSLADSRSGFEDFFVSLQIEEFGRIFSPEEKFALLVACLSHDLDHRGTNNSFQIK